MDADGRGFPPGDLRVSDADRDRALSELSCAFQVGRITAGELDERSGLALRARTGKELTALLADLPVTSSPAVPAPPRVPAAEPAGRSFVPAVIGVSAISATILFLDAVAHSLNTYPTIQQQEFMRQMAAAHGMPVPPITTPPGFDWVGTLAPLAIALALVTLIIVLRANHSGRPAGHPEAR